MERKAEFFLVDNLGGVNTTVTHRLCPICGTRSNAPDFKASFVTKCSQCGATLNFFSPTPIQEKIIKDPSHEILSLGGFGSGKTITNAFKASVHLRKYPNSKLGVAAQTADQLQKTAKQDLNKFFLEEEFLSKTKDSWILFNGSRVDFILSDPQKIRSLSFSYIWLLEISKFDMTFLKEIGGRLRHQVGIENVKDDTGALVYDYDAAGVKTKRTTTAMQMALESNPDLGVVRREYLWKSSRIFYTPSVRGIESLHKQVKPQEEYRDLATYITSTVDNTTLATDVATNMFSASTKAETDRNKYADMSYEEGLVYPNLVNHIIEPFSLSQKYKFVIGYDPGHRDNDGILIGAYIPGRSELIIIDYNYDTNNTFKDSGDIIKLLEYKYFDSKNERLAFRVIDPQANNNSKGTGTFSGIEAMRRDHKLVFRPATKDIISGIGQVNSYLKEGQLKIFSSVVPLIDEAKEYRWAEPKSGELVAAQKPKTGQKDHLLDALRYIVMEFTISFDGYLVPKDKDVYRSRSDSTAHADYLDHLEQQRNNKIDVLTVDDIFKPIPSKNTNTNKVWRGGKTWK